MFWYEMLLYWSELIYKDKISTFQDVVNQPLWFNSHVKYYKAVLYVPSLAQQAIMLIADILTADHKLPTLTQLNAMFNANLIKHQHHIHTIPTLLYTVKSIKTKATKFFYTALMKQHITQTQKTINKWKRDLHMDEIDI